MTTVHTYPANDLIEHELEGDGCPCGPTTEHVIGEDGAGRLVVHHSLDGRERTEREG